MRRILPFIVLFSLLLRPAPALAACGDIPIDHVTYAGEELKLEEDVDVNGSGANEGTTGANSTLDPDASRSTATPTLPDLDPSSFPANSSGVDADEGDSPFLVTGTQFWEKIEIDESETATFTGGGTFHIDELVVKEDATVVFTAGTYFIRKLVLEDNVDLVAALPTVRLHIGEEADIKEDVDINKAGLPGDLLVLLHEDATLKTDEDVEFTGIIFGPEAEGVELGEDNSYRGVLVTGGKVEVEEGTSFTLGVVDEVSIAGATSCEGGSSPPPPPPPPAEDTIANWTFDDEDYDGTAGEVTDSTSYGNDGTALGNAQLFDGGLCRALNIPQNSSDAVQDAVDTGLDVDDAIGNKGSITFFYRNRNNWNGGGSRTLLDASLGNKYFSLSRTNDGRIYFGLEDTADGDMQLRTPRYSVAPERWIHFAITWDLENDRYEIWLVGIRRALSTFNSNGQIAELDTLYIGDNRGTYHPTASGNSAFGDFDEVKVYNYVIDQAQIQADAADTRDCSGGDPADFLVSHDNSGINCLDETITITARDDAGDPLTDYEGQVTLDTQNGNGSWSLVTGAGTFDATGAGPGTAYYTFAAADSGTATFALSYPSGPDTMDIDAFVTSDTAIRDDDSEGDLVFRPTGFSVTASALSNPPPASINDPVPTQTAGVATPYTLHLAAYGQLPGDSQCGIIESYAGPRPIRFWTDHVNPGTGTRTQVVNGTASGTNATATAQTVVFDAGQASVVVSYKDVGQVRLNARDDASYSAPLTGASNAFVVRPDSIATTAVAAGATANPGASSATGPAFVAAGDPFAVTVEVRDSDGDPVPNFGNEASAETLTVASAQLVVPASGGRNGSANGALAGGTGFARDSGGVFTAGNVVFDEVGVIRLQTSITSGSYLGTAPGLSSALTGNVGRFHPKRIELVSSGVTAACNGLTWMGQPGLGVAWSLRAITDAGAIVENFDQGDLGTAGTGSVVLVAENADAGTDLGARLTSLGAAWSNGTSVLNGTATFSRPATPDGPFDSLQLGVQLSGAPSGVALAGLDMAAGSSGNCGGACDALAIGAPTSVRFGRLQLLPTFGPETAALDLGLEAQAFVNGRWVRDSRDSCTTYAGSAVTLSGYSGNLDPGETSVSGPASSTALVAGAANPNNPLRLSAPGEGNTGTVQVELAVDAWFEFDWDGDGSVDEPSSTATFGIHRGHDSIIYWRETP